MIILYDIKSYSEVLSKSLLLDTRQYKNGVEKVISSTVLELLTYKAECEREKINVDRLKVSRLLKMMVLFSVDQSKKSTRGLYRRTQNGNKTILKPWKL
jgi:hypothetical protein